MKPCHCERCGNFIFGEVITSTRESIGGGKRKTEYICNDCADDDFENPPESIYAVLDMRKDSD